MDQIHRVIDNLYNGNLSDIREIFKNLPSREAAHLAAQVTIQLVNEDGDPAGTLIGLLSHD